MKRRVASSSVPRTVVSSNGRRYVTNISKAKFKLGIAELEGSSAVVDTLIAVAEGTVRNAYFRHSPEVNPDFVSNPDAFQRVIACSFIRTLVNASDLSNHATVEGENVHIVFSVRSKLLARYKWLKPAIRARQYDQGEAFRTLVIENKRCTVDAYFDSYNNLSLFVTPIQ